MSKICDECKGKGCELCKNTGYEIDENMKLRIWHMPQIGVKDCTFNVNVKNVDEAAKLLNTLWDYDNFQFEKRLKPDFSNASGLEYFDKEDKEWQEYYDEEGNDIGQIIEAKEELKNNKN